MQRNRNDPKLTTYYKRYCRILSNVITQAKKEYYNSILTCSDNNTQTTWNITKNTIKMKPNTYIITPINTNGDVFVNGQIVTETFNNYFVTVAQNINVNDANASSNHGNPISYLTRAFNQPFPTITPKEI